MIYALVVVSYGLVSAIHVDSDISEVDPSFRIKFAQKDPIPVVTSYDVENRSRNEDQNSYDFTSNSYTDSASIHQNEIQDHHQGKSKTKFKHNMQEYRECPKQCYRRALAILSWFNNLMQMSIYMISCLISLIEGSYTLSTKLLKVSSYMFDPIALCYATILSIILISAVVYVGGRPRSRDFFALLLFTSFSNQYALKTTFNIILRILMRVFLWLLHLITHLAYVLLWFAYSQVVTEVLIFCIGATVVGWTLYGLRKGCHCNTNDKAVYLTAFLIGLMTYQGVLYLIFRAVDGIEFALNVVANLQYFSS